MVCCVGYMLHMSRSLLMAVALAMILGGLPAVAQGTFTAHPPGALKDRFGTGSRDFTLYAPGMRFPIGAPTTTVNSQLRNPGSYLVSGDQCDARNYSEVWFDTFCEQRDGKNRASLNCKSREIHQGIDIRGGTSETCRALVRGERDNVPVLAVYDGVIERISSYTVYLRTGFGTFHYLHMNMKSLPYGPADLPKAVKAGDLMGYMSNDFGKTSTTFHLHFEHWMAIAGKGVVPVPLYCDLVLAYERDTGKRHVVADGSQRCDGTLAPPAGTSTSADSAGAAAGTGTTAATPVTDDAGEWLNEAAASYWRYRGSVLKLVTKGDRRVLVYDVPRGDLTALAPKGTVFFDGRKTGNRYGGQARVFTPGCPAQAYDVEGPIEDGGKRIILLGTQPQIGTDCKVAATSAERLVVLFDRPAEGSGGDGGASAALPGGGAIAGNGQVLPSCSRERCVDRLKFLADFAKFYNASNRRKFNQWQADALNAVLNVWDTDDGLHNDSRLAYILGTIYHESAHSVYPVREGSCETDEGSVAYSKYIYRKRITTYDYFERDPQTKQSYYGRGQVQITFKDNYDVNGGRLGLGSRLVTAPDDTLSYEISAKLAVLGAYHGWYRKRYAVKNYDFENDADWLRARDVIIGAGRGAQDIASFARKFLPMLTFIDRATFQQKYGTATGGPASPVSGESNAPAIAGPVTAPAELAPESGTAAGDGGGTEAPAGSATATEPAPAVPEDQLIAEANRRLGELDALADDLQQRSLELSLKVAAVRGVLDLASRKSASGGAKSADGEDGGMAKSGEVDLRETWPPGHKPSKACALTGAKANDEITELDPDDPLVLLHGDLLTQGAGEQSP